MTVEYAEASAPLVEPGVTFSVKEALGREIVQERYGAQPFPSENELMARFGVSRSSVREAVKMLSAKGLVTSRPKRGISVTPLDGWSLYDADVLRWLVTRAPTLRLTDQLLELRLAVEPSAAALAARSATPPERHEIAVTAQHAAAERAGEGTCVAEQRFHSAVLRGSRNPFYINLIRTACASIEITRARGSSEERDGRLITDVALAISEGRANDAASAMRALLNGQVAGASRRVG